MCLPGGGAAGLNQVGMLRALSPYRDRIAAVSCASVGALNGCLFVKNKLDRLTELWVNLRRKDVFRYLPTRSSYFSSTPLARLISREVDMNAMRRSHILFQGHTTELGCGACRVFSQWGRDADEFNKHLLAGASIPIAFPPVKIDGMWFQDGGMSDNTPMMPLITNECDTIIVLNCHSIVRPQPSSGPAPSRLSQLRGIVSQFMRASQTRDSDFIEWRNTKHPDTPIRLIEIWGTESIGTLDFGVSTERAITIIDRNEQLAKSILHNTLGGADE